MSSEDERPRARQAWRADEDALLISIVEQHGPHSWAKVAEAIKTRTPSQCSERWRTQLAPGIRKEAWRPEEDKMILESAPKKNGRWSTLAASLPGRSRHDVKNRYNALQRTEAGRHSALAPATGRALSAGGPMRLRGAGADDSPGQLAQRDSSAASTVATSDIGKPAFPSCPNCQWPLGSQQVVLKSRKEVESSQAMIAAYNASQTVFVNGEQMQLAVLNTSAGGQPSYFLVPCNESKSSGGCGRGGAGGHSSSDAACQSVALASPVEQLPAPQMPDRHVNVVCDERRQRFANGYRDVQAWPHPQVKPAHALPPHGGCGACYADASGHYAEASVGGTCTQYAEAPNGAMCGQYAWAQVPHAAPFGAPAYGSLQPQPSVFAELSSHAATQPAYPMTKPAHHVVAQPHQQAFTPLPLPLGLPPLQTRKVDDPLAHSQQSKCVPASTLQAMQMLCSMASLGGSDWESVLNSPDARQLGQQMELMLNSPDVRQHVGQQLSWVQTSNLSVPQHLTTACSADGSANPTPRLAASSSLGHGGLTLTPGSANAFLDISEFIDGALGKNAHGMR